MGKKGQKRLVAFLLSTSLLMSMCMPVSAEEVNTPEVTEEETLMMSGWQGSLSEGNRYYISENGERLAGIQTIEGKTYYFDTEGILQTGWQTVEGEQYYFSLETGGRYENLTAVIDGTEYDFAADGTYTVISDPSSDDEDSSASDETTGPANGSDSDEITEPVDDSETEDAENEQQQIPYDEIMADEETESNSADTDNDLNTLNPVSTRALDGKQKIDGSYYYYKDGECLKNTWIEDGNNKYYATEDGKLHTGWLKFGSTYYYCASNASVVYGLQYVGSDRYYFDEEGIRQESKWIDVNGKRYYAMEDGKLHVGWLKTGSTYYYCSSTGALVYGLQYVGSDRYYFDEEGIRQESKWIDVNGKRYYAMEDGKLRVGWLKTGSTYYYCSSTGALVYGLQYVGSDRYYFDEKGIRQESKWIDVNGKRYYAMEDGKLRVGWLKTGSTYYYCGPDAALIVNQNYPVNGVLYTFDANGVRQIKPGWGEYNGNRYYINAQTGFPYTGWLKFGSIYYYANKYGWLMKGWQTINGYRYYFYLDTYQMAKNTTINGIYIGSDGKASTVYTYAVDVLNQVGWNLRAAYNWSASMPYYRMDSSPSQGSEWFALYGFRNHTGNCYVMAATFYYMAKALGYDAHQVAGYVPKIGGGVTPHSWVEIVINGTVYVFDPNFTNETGGNGYQIRYGTSGTWMYSSYYRMN